MSLILDASMAITWLFDSEHTEASHQVLSRVGSHGALVPSIWQLEVANVLRNAVRRGRCDDTFAERSLQRLARLPIAADEETATHAWTSTYPLARAENLTVYDAAYLELALRVTLPLASCDAALIDAARRRNIAVLTA